jgi:AcrR family transcriptional regulator
VSTASETAEADAAAERREQLSRKLLPVIERMLDEESFTEISVERLVKEADVSKSAFYIYFRDKGDLLRELIADVMTDMFGVAAVWWELPAGATKQQLRDAIDTITAAYLPHRKLMAATVEASSYDREVAAVFGGLMAQAHQMVAGYIERGQGSGDVRAGIDVDRTATWIMWMFERGLQQLVSVSGPADQARQLTALTDILWRTLYVKDG